MRSREGRAKAVSGAAFLLCCSLSAAARGEEREEREEREEGAPSLTEEDEAARNDSTPLPKKSVLRFEPSYTFLHGGGGTVELKIQPTLRYDGVFIPGLMVSDLVSFARLEIYTRSIDDREKNIHETGLADTVLTNGVAHTFSRRLALGAGYSTTIPMATSPGLDHQQWLLGPSVYFTSEPIDGLELALLVNDYFTIAKHPGTSSYPHMTVKPYVTWHFGHGWLVGSDATMTIDFSGNGRTDIPLNLGPGKAFGRYVASAQGWYTVAGDKQGDVGVHLKLTVPL
jgi:hypothetical protein